MPNAPHPHIVHSDDNSVSPQVSSYVVAAIRVLITDVDHLIDVGDVSDTLASDDIINRFNCYFDTPPAPARCVADWTIVKCCTAMAEMDDDVDHTLEVRVRAYRIGDDTAICAGTDSFRERSSYSRRRDERPREEYSSSSERFRERPSRS